MRLKVLFEKGKNIFYQGTTAGEPAARFCVLLLHEIGVKGLAETPPIASPSMVNRLRKVSFPPLSLGFLPLICSDDGGSVSGIASGIALLINQALSSAGK
jgi:hypothetical protein